MKRTILLFILIISSNSLLSRNIEGKWLFKSINKTDQISEESIKPIADGDFMLIEKNGRFTYQLSSIPIYANGIWELKDNVLKLKYNKPNDTIRFYKVKLENNDLILNEAEINFLFSKSTVASELNPKVSFYSFFRGILGIASLILISYVFSRNRKK